MTPLTPSLHIQPSLVAGDLATLGRQVPPPGHMGFRNTSGTPATPPARGNAPDGESEAVPPPIHRNLKPQRKGLPSSQPADIQTVKEPTRKTRGRTWSVTNNPWSSSFLLSHSLSRLQFSKVQGLSFIPPFIPSLSACFSWASSIPVLSLFIYFLQFSSTQLQDNIACGSHTCSTFNISTGLD